MDQGVVTCPDERLIGIRPEYYNNDDEKLQKVLACDVLCLSSLC